jgi:hypothetical protein
MCRRKTLLATAVFRAKAIFWNAPRWCRERARLHIVSGRSGQKRESLKWVLVFKSS